MLCFFPTLKLFLRSWKEGLLWCSHQCHKSIKNMNSVNFYFIPIFHFVCRCILKQLNKLVLPYCKCYLVYGQLTLKNIGEHFITLNPSLVKDKETHGEHKFKLHSWDRGHREKWIGDNIMTVLSGGWTRSRLRVMQLIFQTGWETGSRD